MKADTAVSALYRFLCHQVDFMTSRSNSVTLFLRDFFFFFCKFLTERFYWVFKHILLGLIKILKGAVNY